MKKKLSLVFFVIIIASVLSAAPSIKVTSPSKYSWQQGSTFKIKWKVSGIQHRFVKINLFDCNGNRQVLKIAGKTGNSGVFAWTIPYLVPDGKYFVRVKTLDNTVSSDSSCFPISQVVRYKFHENMGTIEESSKPQLDPKYLLKKNVFIPNQKQKKNTTTGELTPSKTIIPFGGKVDLKIFFLNALRVKVTNKTTNEQVYFRKGEKPVSKTVFKEVSIIAEITKFKMEVFGPKSSYIAYCWVKTLPVVDNFQLQGLIGGKLHFIYRFRGCEYGWLKSADDGTDNWVREEKLTGYPFDINSPIRKGTVEITPRGNKKRKYAIYLIGKNGVVKSNEIQF